MNNYLQPDVSSFHTTSDSETDSDLKRDQSRPPTTLEETNSSLIIDQFSRKSSPDLFIGGAKVKTANTVRPQLARGRSIYDEESNNDEDEELLPVRTNEHIGSQSEISSDTDLSTIQKSQQGGQQNQETHKIFTFSLPFGGKSIIPTTSLSNIFNSVLPNEKDYKKEAQNRHKIKEKLKRSDSITSLEERALFKNTKGIENVRARAFKKTFELESLKQTLKNLTSSEGELTSDGYEVSRLDSIWNEVEGDFLVMGGYRGSVLRDADTHRRVWIPIRAGLNFRKVDLLIGPSDQDETQAQKLIKPDGMLTHIGPVDVAKRLIKRLRSNPKVNVVDYGYDWRLSLDISADQLCRRLEQIYEQQKVKKGTFIIAHSMGGLVAHKVLQDHTHLVRGIIYVGAPSQCPNILGPLKFGDEVLMNKTILSKEANFFMRSSFYFLPTKGTCFVNKKTYRKYNIDFFDTATWVELGLSPVVDEARKQLEERKLQTGTEDTPEINEEQSMARTESKEKQPQPGISAEVRDLLGLLNPVPILRSLSGSNAPASDSTKPLKILDPTPLLSKLSSTATDVIGLKEGKQCQEDEQDMTFVTPYDECVQYLERTLHRAKNYLLSLEHIKHKTYPPLVIVYSKSVPTVRGVKIDSLVDIKKGNYDDFYYGPGDGVVHHKWLLPEQRGFPLAAKIESSCGHVSLLSDLDSMAKALISLVDKETDKNIKDASCN